MTEYPERLLPTGKVAMILPLTYGRARLHVGDAGSMFFDDGW